MIDQVRALLDDTDRLLDAVAVARGKAQEELTALRFETCRRRLVHVRNVLLVELRDQELERGTGALVTVPRNDYQRRRP